MPLGESRATLVYFDDTGYHPSELESVTSTAEERLSVVSGYGVGEIILVGNEVGFAAVEVVGAEGFTSDRTFHYALDIIDTGGAEIQCDEDDAYLLPIEAE